jgi:uncharacterized NAD(P)/FAD-binding protein YdhS
MMEADVAIVGGGFSGCAVTAQLARRASPDLSLVLVEPGDLGRGAAYATRHPEHLLNTRAGMMSLFPEDANHFVRWLGPDSSPEAFVSRRRYGAYVNECARRAFDRPQFSVVHDFVRRIARSEDARFDLETESGRRFSARAVVLATGNPLPGDDFLPREVRLHPGYVADPWRFDYRNVGGHVLLVGSGLTALDVLVALETSGHRGTVHVVSRRGRYPEVHADVTAYEVVPALDARSARTLLRSFRRHVAEAAKLGFDWRAVVDAIRPEADAIWRRLPLPERGRFERHLRVHWERRRHRAPHDVDAVRRRYDERGRLFSYAGTLAALQRGIATIALRDGGSATVRPDWIVNCTGLAGARGYSKNAPTSEMLEAGLLSISHDRLGLRTTHDLAAIGANGEPLENLWIVGPPVRGSRFEATAVPELRAMAETVSAEIVRTLPSRRLILQRAGGERRGRA